MTWASLCCVLGVVLLLVAFLAAVVFVDPAAYFGSEDLDFSGLTSVFFTLDMLPLVFLLFSNDAKVRGPSRLARKGRCYCWSFILWCLVSCASQRFTLWVHDCALLFVLLIP